MLVPRRFFSKKCRVAPALKRFPIGKFSSRKCSFLAGMISLYMLFYVLWLCVILCVILCIISVYYFIYKIIHIMISCRRGTSIFFENFPLGKRFSAGAERHFLEEN